jgi:integrase
MSLVKRGKTWHTHFFVDGQRFRQSLDTSDWREAQAKEKELITSASQGKLAPATQQFSKLNVSDALERYLEDRAAHVQPRSKRSESDHAKPLRDYFGSLPIARISADAILAYVRDRKSKNLSNTTVNMELGILRRIMKRAKRWHFVEDEVPRLPERRDIGRALQPEEKLRLLKVAQTKPEWETAYLASVLALNTTMRGCEIKQLRWRDIDLMDPSLVIRRSKTRAGERVIPLNANAYNAVLRLRARAQNLFGADLQLDWYIFPSAEGYSKPDPTKPMSGWRSAWRGLTRAVTCPVCGEQQSPSDACVNSKCKADLKKVKSPLAGLRFHDLRHHAITELAESQASDRTVMSIAGHVSQRMLAHYSHVRIEAKRKALDVLATGVKKLGYDTSNDTKSLEGAILSSQSIEKNGGDDGTRTRGLCRDRQRPKAQIHTAPTDREAAFPTLRLDGLLTWLPPAFRVRRPSLSEEVKIEICRIR